MNLSDYKTTDAEFGFVKLCDSVYQAACGVSAGKRPVPEISVRPSGCPGIHRDTCIFRHLRLQLTIIFIIDASADYILDESVNRSENCGEMPIRISWSTR